MAETKIKINRAPVMTLWAAVVAERQGYSPEEALTVGRAVAGLNAQAKGRRLGIYEPSEEKPDQARQRPQQDVFSIKLLGRPVPAVNTPDGLRAVSGDDPIKPETVERYLRNKFGESLADVRAAMAALAGAFSPEELAGQAYDLYEKFRPEVPAGVKGWGAQGELDLEYIRSLASEKD